MKNLNRRQFIATTAVVATATPLLLLMGPSVRAANAPEVDPSDPQAKALAYTHESPKADNICANCQLYSGAADSNWGPCAIFPGKQVAGAGWCSAWVKKAG